MTTIAQAVEALRAAAESDDEEESARAKRMLKAMDEEEEAKAEDSEEDDPSAEDDAPPTPKKDDEDESSAKALASQALASAQRAERATILATRPDLSAETKGKLAGVPVAALAAALSAIPRAAATPTPPKAEAPVMGDGQGGTGVIGGRSITPNADLDLRMGITKGNAEPIARTATSITIGTLSRDQANSILSSKNGGAR